MHRLAVLKPRIQKGLAQVTSIQAVNRLLQRSIRQGMVPPALWSRLPVHGTVEVALPGGSTFRYAVVPEDVVGRRLNWLGARGYEFETTRVFEALAQRAEVTLDIGANTGLFSLIAASANPRGKVLSFEPVPSILKRLQANVELNGFGARCRLYPFAIAEHSGTRLFHIPEGEITYSGSLNPNGFYGLKGSLVEVQVRTVDDLCEGLDRVDLIKIDVEGFEGNVLKGMSGVMARSRPSIIFECIMSDQMEEIEALLHGHGYQLYHITDQGPLPISSLSLAITSPFRNVLAQANGN